MKLDEDLMDRSTIARDTPLIMATFDALAQEMGLSYGEFLVRIAAAIGCQQRDSRKLFRKAFDTIERQMHPAETEQ